MMTLNDGRSELWQWDTGRKLAVDADCSQVHFSNKVFGRSIDVDVVEGVAIIPDILLQTDKELTAWAFVGTPENGYTKISKVFKVNKRNKPADYVFTPQDQSTLGEILDRIEDLEKRPSGDVSEEEIQNAVSDYLEKNPISVVEKDPTVPNWAKNPEKPTYTPEEIGAQPAGDYALRDEIPLVPEMPEIPSALPNPHKLTFTGAVNAEYDGSEAVEVEIPAGGGGVVEKQGMELLTTVTVAEDVTVINISQCDDGTLFEAKKLTRIGVFMTIAGNSAVTTDAPLSAFAGTDHPMYGRLPIPKMISSSTKKGSIEFRTIGRQIYMDAFSDSQRYHGGSSVVNASGKFSNAFPTINNIRLFYDGSGYVIPAGSTFEVWGY